MCVLAGFMSQRWVQEADVSKSMGGLKTVELASDRAGMWSLGRRTMEASWGGEAFVSPILSGAGAGTWETAPWVPCICAHEIRTEEAT